MSNPNRQKVSVNIEIVVESDGQPTVSVKPKVPETIPGQPTITITPFGPDPTGDTPVFVYNGVKCIEANGTSYVSHAQNPDLVKAIVYPNPNAVPPSLPPNGAVTGTLLNNGADWRFSKADNNPVPTAICDSTVNGSPNNLFVVWFHYPRGNWIMESTPFHGYCPTGSSSVSPKLLPTTPPPATLVAQFTGQLQVLAPIKLVWNGLNWVAVFPDHGGAILTFSGNGATYQLQSSGQAALFVLATAPASSKPFIWSAAGIAVGTLQGPFSITITEEPHAKTLY